MGHGAWGMGHGAWGMGHGALVVKLCAVNYAQLLHTGELKYWLWGRVFRQSTPQTNNLKNPPPPHGKSKYTFFQAIAPVG
ncbi:hypothetical protein QUB35_36280, partial [Microcoleus sp. B13-B6]